MTIEWGSGSGSGSGGGAKADRTKEEDARRNGQSSRKGYRTELRTNLLNVINTLPLRFHSDDLEPAASAHARVPKQTETATRCSVVCVITTCR
jgi:hypothetical protein